MHSDFPERMCMHQSLSLSPPPSCKNGLDQDQTRMEFRKVKNVRMRWKVRSVVQKPMRTIRWGISISQLEYTLAGPMRGYRGGSVGPDPPPPPLKNHKNIEFLSKTGPDPWNSPNSQSYEASVQRWASIGTPAKRHFRWRADDGLLLVIFGSSLP